MAATILSRQLRRTFVTISPISTFLHRYSTPQPPHSPSNPIPLPHHHHPHHPTSRPFSSASGDYNYSAKAVKKILLQVEQEKESERAARKKAGLDTADIDAEDDEDYMRVGPLIEKLDKEMLKEGADIDLMLEEEPSDSEDEDEDDNDNYDVIERRNEIFKKKCNRHGELIQNFVDAGTVDEAYKWMKRIDQFEEKHFPLHSEYRVIGDLMNRLKVATTVKEKFLLQQKLNRAIRLISYKEAYDPNNPANYGVIPNPEQAESSADHLQHAEFQTEKPTIDEDGEEEFDDMKERDNVLLEQLSAIDKKLEEKLADLDHTFGKKGKLLEEEIRALAEERNALTEKKRRPLYRKGFDVKLIDVNRTCKVTKGGQVIKYTAMLACGNYHGVIGFAKAKGPSVDIALQKAHEKCFQNLHYVERHEEHTIAHAVQTSFKKTKLYLWPARTQTGMKAGRTVQTILNLAGFKNLKSKVVGSRNPHNTVKALFKALNAIETPKDVQEKFGRTVVESYLL